MATRRWPDELRPLAAVLALLAAAGLSACGPAFQPKQAEFVVSGCEAGAALDPLATKWGWAARPVLEPGAPGEWDAVDVLNPSVTQVEGIFYNLYSGFDGATWHTGLALSRDGIAWEKRGRALSPDPATWEADYIAANGSVLYDSQRFLYWYQAGERGRTRIALAVSDDAARWEKHPEPVLDFGAPGSWDEAGLGDPYVIRCGASFYLFYLGQNRDGLQRLGLARSEDGVHWQKSGSNPILDVGGPGGFDELGLGEPSLFVAGGRFYMLYTGRDAREERRIGWAESDDGVDWNKIPSAPALAGFSDWNARVVCDTTLWRDGERILVWFGGGDRASPDENLNGKIGFAWMEANGAAAAQ